MIVVDTSVWIDVPRRAGVTIRKTLDCLIAVPCVRAEAPLLHADADFDRLASCTALRLYPLD
jgi:predicted nucleic acid-binding protein